MLMFRQVFMGTPHRGSRPAELGILAARVVKVVGKHPNDKLISALREDSQVLEGQSATFSSISSKIPLVCLCEQMETNGTMVSFEKTKLRLARLC